MSSRPRRRRSPGETYGKSTPEPKQRYFTPKIRSVRSRPSTSSNTRKRQQTITQMEPLRDFFHPDQDDGLVYDGVPSKVEQEQPKKKRRKTMPVRRENSLTQMGYGSSSLQGENGRDVMQELDMDYIPETSSRGSKRRKTTPARSTHIPQTRSSKRQAAQREIKGEEETVGSARPFKIEKSNETQRNTAAELMPPPKTPKSSRRKEIPSSQSPADTPLSTQSRTSRREQSRSPLKERSTNLHVYSRYPRKTIGQGQGFVVADSMDDTNTDSSTYARTEGARMPTVMNSTLSITPASKSQMVFAIREQSLVTVPLDQHLMGAHSPAKEAGVANSAIMDSDDEGSEDVFTDSGLDSDPKPQRGHTITGLGISDAPIQFTVNNRGYQDGSERIKNSLVSAASNPAAESNMPKYNFTQHSQALNGPQPHEQARPRSDSEEASAQLTAESLRTTQSRPLVETDSQWEATWHPFSDPQGPEAYGYPKPNFSSSAASGNPPAFLTPPVPHSQPALPGSLTRLPHSQATTVDITQPSSQLPFSSAQRTLSTLSPPPRILQTCSSSPLRILKDGEAYTGHTTPWNGERLTDSQLLPESLMQDSMTVPPPLLFMEEDWEGEGE